MPIYRIDDNRIVPIRRTTFAQEGLRERSDLQSFLRSRIDIISPEILLIGEEIGVWEDSRRRIDLLGVDTDANLVVIELKRTEDGGHMELQALRYAAMISSFTFEDATKAYETFLRKMGETRDARETLLEFFEWNEPQEESFGQEVKIVLASADFSRELMTSVMWLNEFGVDIRCVKMQPYEFDGQVLIDVQTILPIPEAADFQVRIREKKQRERESRQTSRDTSKQDLTVAGKQFPKLNKRNMMFRLVTEIFENGGSPERIREAIPARNLIVFEGTLVSEEVQELILKDDPGGRLPRTKRFFCEEGEPYQIGGSTYVLSNQWGRDTAQAARALAEAFPDLGIDFRESPPAES